MPSPVVSPDDVQGNILKSFGRDHAVYLFFRCDGTGVQSDLGRLLRTFVTPASLQQANTDSRRRDRAISESRGETFDQPGIGVGMFGLSASGYKRLGLEGVMPRLSAGAVDPFGAGMKVGGPNYPWQPRIDLWEENYRTEEIDGFLLLAHDSVTQLEAAEATVRTELDRIGEIVAREQGGRLRRGQPQRDLEHFGFSDGVAQIPVPEDVFTADVTTGPGGLPSHGSFAVFMKMEQNVLAFERVTADLAQQADVAAEDVRERVVGRRRNGYPLVAFQNGDPNDFSFAGEGDDRCPFHAHVRMMNPRDGTATRAIVRRGMTYGPPRVDLASPGRQLPPSSGVGLLFLSFQKSLNDFLFLMRRARTYRDPLLSHSGDWKAAFTNSITCTRDGTPGQRWRLNGRDICYPVADLTTIRGGEYFYVPGMDFIRRL